MILIALPHEEFDPTEAAVPWKVLTKAGLEVRFATPEGKQGKADPRVLTGKGFGLWRPFLMAGRNGIDLYREMEEDDHFKNPIPYREIEKQPIQGLILPGGHAPGMKEYLESDVLQGVVAGLFEDNKPVGAICHGVIVAARSKLKATGRSVLFGRKTTALPKFMELPAWMITRAWLGGYFKTYPETVQEIVTQALENKEDFIVGPRTLRRDSEARTDRGFAVIDANYVSARWPGDAYRFATEFLEVAK